jgi:hypothetical protein
VKNGLNYKNVIASLLEAFDSFHLQEERREMDAKALGIWERAQIELIP